MIGRQMHLSVDVLSAVSGEVLNDGDSCSVYLLF